MEEIRFDGRREKQLGGGSEGGARERGGIEAMSDLVEHVAQWKVRTDHGEVTMEELTRIIFLIMRRDEKWVLQEERVTRDE